MKVVLVIYSCKWYLFNSQSLAYYYFLINCRFFLKAPFLRAYSVYYTHFTDSLSTISNEMSRNQYFAAFLQVTSKKKMFTHRCEICHIPNCIKENTTNSGMPRSPL
jgi:hypothetical protein